MDSSKIERPIISIVTPSLNQAPFLEKAILSILKQDCQRIEYIVIDGGSNDGSIDIIRRYSDQIDYWVSERDRGQADAINIGLKRAKGELFGWINSDDILLPGSAKILLDAHIKYPGAILLGDVINIDIMGNPLELVRQKGVSLENLVCIWKTGWGWHQPGTFFPKSVWEEIGPLDISLRYMFDRDWICRAIQKAHVVYLRVPVAGFRVHQSSKTATGSTRWIEELYQVGMRYRHLVKGATPRALKAGCYLHEAINLITNQKRNMAIKTLAKAINTYPAICLNLGFLRNILRALIPLPLLEKMRELRMERSLRDLKLSIDYNGG
jgi:glycosyltransferase involved in cell wall biosynthesis